MEVPKTHEFRFVIGECMKKSLEKLDVFKGVMSFSGIVEKILLLLAPVVRREHKWGKQRMSRYRYVSPDPKEKRKHVHAYLDEDVYRELKLLHHDLNFFSIAQIVRGFLEMFLVLVEEYGDNILQELDKMFKQWGKLVSADRLTMRESLGQLWKLAHHIPENNRLITLYDEHFTPFRSFRL